MDGSLVVRSTGYRDETIRRATTLQKAFLIAHLELGKKNTNHLPISVTDTSNSNSKTGRYFLFN